MKDLILFSAIKKNLCKSKTAIWFFTNLVSISLAPGSFRNRYLKCVRVNIYQFLR